MLYYTCWYLLQVFIYPCHLEQGCADEYNIQRTVEVYLPSVPHHNQFLVFLLPTTLISYFIFAFLMGQRELWIYHMIIWVPSSRPNPYVCSHCKAGTAKGFLSVLLLCSVQFMNLMENFKYTSEPWKISGRSALCVGTFYYNNANQLCKLIRNIFSCFTEKTDKSTNESTIYKFLIGKLGPAIQLDWKVATLNELCSFSIWS